MAMGEHAHGRHQRFWSPSLLPARHGSPLVEPEGLLRSGAAAGIGCGVR
jgi:hypothetical protein